MVPPKSYPFMAMTAPPSQTIIKTISKIKLASSASVSPLRSTESNKVKRNGPHKSQLRTSCLFASMLFGVPLKPIYIGLITILSLPQILFKSLLIVSMTGSSKVLRSLNYGAAALLAPGPKPLSV